MYRQFILITYSKPTNWEHESSVPQKVVECHPGDAAFNSTVKIFSVHWHNISHLTEIKAKATLMKTKQLNLT